MAHFLGQIEGQRGPASRLGSKASGLRTVAASWQGAVETTLYEREGVDYARVSLRPWHGNGTSQLIFDGPVSGQSEPAHSPA
jgi:hypothetical protein